MKAFRVLIAILLVLVALSFAAPAGAAYGRTLTGELVAMSGTQFRIVGHGGPFTAPSGTPLSALDGKTVQVEISPSGGVTQITEVSVPINPVVHGWSTVRGELQVTDAMNRRFTFAGDTQTYVAPPAIDITQYAGKHVEIKMDETGQVTGLHLVSPAPQGAWNPPSVASGCTYGGQTYSAGSAVCQSGTQYRCDGSLWQSLGLTCQVAGAADAPVRVPPQSPRSCVIGDATVANGSSICRSGATFRCDDGAWINAQTACR